MARGCAPAWGRPPRRVRPCSARLAVLLLLSARPAAEQGLPALALAQFAPVALCGAGAARGGRACWARCHVRQITPVSPATAPLSQCRASPSVCTQKPVSQVLHERALRLAKLRLHRHLHVPGGSGQGDWRQVRGERPQEKPPGLVWCGTWMCALAPLSAHSPSRARPRGCRPALPVRSPARRVAPGTRSAAARSTRLWTPRWRKSAKSSACTRCARSHAPCHRPPQRGRVRGILACVLNPARRCTPGKVSQAHLG